MLEMSLHGDLQQQDSGQSKVNPHLAQHNNPKRASKAQCTQYNATKHFPKSKTKKL